MPSNVAQTSLIRDTYTRSGLDINNPLDRPQFFHAHGTGTPAGDPQEAEAISRSFFDETKETTHEKLYVGSIKTVIGHTEGSAGLASLIGSAKAMQHGVIPPNLHFNNLSPKVAPFFTNLQIPTTVVPWPELAPGQPRRASVNSFGFGGTNAHAILEYYEPKPRKTILGSIETSFTPLTISAGSAATLRSVLANMNDYLKIHPETKIRDLAHTLQSRRSTLPYRKAIVASTVEDAIKRLEGLLADESNGDLGTRYADVAKPTILGIFTGQGAQWPRMGAELIEQSPFAAQRIAELQRALATLPDEDRPDWTISSQLLAEPKTSRLAEAAIAQPLCTAVQIVLVDLLKAAGIELAAAVGHSSGEIGAAYASGFLSATDAIRVAYYRGVCAKLASAPSGVKGSMMAVGATPEEAHEVCASERFIGKMQVAAINSPTSITLSGDEDAIDAAVELFQEQSKFARKLRVDTAYHSTHMLPCAKPYLAGLARAGYSVRGGNATKWFSSVTQPRIMTREDIEDPQYWVDNMTSAVLFEPAVAMVSTEFGSFDMGIEFGPHPALKGPALDSMQEAIGKKTAYTGLLARNKDDVNELSAAIGYMWTQLGSGLIKFDPFEKLISGTFVAHGRRPVKDLPTYPFDHSRSFYSLTRFSGAHRNIHTAPHPLLGRRFVETETADEITWRNVLKPQENSWLQGHGLQGQSVFPATGYISTALEAVVAANPDRKIGLFSVDNISIRRALAFSDENASIEFKVTLKVTKSTDDDFEGRITCHSGLPYDHATPLALNFSATVSATFHEPEADTLPDVRHTEINLVKAGVDRLYSQFDKLGYNYSSPFRGIRSVQRKLGWAAGEVVDESGNTWEDRLLVHPGWLDSALQTGFAAYSHPHDNRLFTLSVPTAIQSVIINPYFCDISDTRNRSMQYQTSSRGSHEGQMSIDIDIFSGGDSQAHPYVQFQGIDVQPFAAATPRDDIVLYTRHHFRSALPNAADHEVVTSEENNIALLAAERIAFSYLRRLNLMTTDAERKLAKPHFSKLLDFAAATVETVERGEHPYVPREAVRDSLSYIRSLVTKHYSNNYVRLLEVAGDYLIDGIRTGESTIYEQLMKDGRLDDFYTKLTAESPEDSINAAYANVISQIAFRFPRMNILEIGAGSHGGSLASILPALGDAFTTYTYTEVTTNAFENIQNEFGRKYSDRLILAEYDVNKPAGEQGIEEGSYDVVVATAALTTTNDLDVAVGNARKLLKAGGYLIVLDVNTNDSLSLATIRGSSAPWWAGAVTGDAERINGPTVSTERWDSLLRRNGFSGIDSHTGTGKRMLWYSVFVSQAMDERVEEIRAPLTSLTNNKPVLFIIGGRTSSVFKLSKAVSSMLCERYMGVILVKSIEELTQQGIIPGSSVLSLTELDEPLLEQRTAPKIDALKDICRNAGTVLWVTRSAGAEQPYSSMMVGLTRVVRHEFPSLTLQLLDLDHATEATPELVAESLAQLELGVRFKKEEAEDLLWNVEFEHYYVNGQLLIPRLLPDVAANNRYHTYRRSVQDEVNPQKTTVVLEPTADGNSFELATVSPLRVLPEPQTAGQTVTLRVEQSLLQAIKIGDLGSFNLFVGTDLENHEQFIAICDSAIESKMTVPVAWTMCLPPSKDTKGDISAAIAVVAAFFLSQSIISVVPRRGTVLIHERRDYSEML